MNPSLGPTRIYPSAAENAVAATICLISNSEEILCNNPEYVPNTGSVLTGDSIASSITATPRSDLRLETVCFVSLREGYRPVAVAPLDDGTIRLDGAYVNRIASELDIQRRITG